MAIGTSRGSISVSDIAKLSPSDRITTLLAIGEPATKRLTSQFVESQCKLQSVTTTSPTTATAIFTFTVSPFYCNGSGNLHGGAQSLFFDMCTSLALMSIGDVGSWINGGVSRTLNVTYLRPAPEGTEIELEAEVVAAGKSMAMLRGLMRRAADGVPISTCEHGKAAVGTKPNWKL